MQENLDAYMIEPAHMPEDAQPICRLMDAHAAEEGGANQLDVQALTYAMQGTPKLAIFMARTRDSAEAVGCIIAYEGYDVLSASKGMHMSDIYVMPEHRAKGLGRALLSSLCAWSYQQQEAQWCSWTVLKDNAPAKTFYRHLGAVEVDVDFMAMGVTVMKQLSS